MATVLRFENRAASTTVDILATATDGVKALANHWRQSAPMGGKVTEVYRIVFSESSVANVISDVQKLENLLEAAFDWHADPLLDESVWLRFAADGETAKRALVYSYEMVPIGGALGREMALNTKVGFDLAVTRHMFWEDVSATTETGSAVSVWGGEWDLTSTITGGRVDSRISEMRVLAPASTSMDRLWVGIRQPREATAAFSGARDLHTNFTAVNSSKATGATGETGTGHILVDFSVDGESMQFRAYELLGNSADDYIGSYILLLRYKLSGGTSGTCGVRGSAGFGIPSSNAPLQQLSTQYVDSTDWDIVELGEIQIPPSGYRHALKSAMGSINNLSVSLEASRIDGDHDLLLDGVCFIPAEHHLVLEGTLNETIGYWYMFGYEDDKVEAYGAANIPPITLQERMAIRGADTWRYPHEGGLLVFAARQSTLPHDTTDTIGPDIEVHKRWRTYHD